MGETSSLSVSTDANRFAQIVRAKRYFGHTLGANIHDLQNISVRYSLGRSKIPKPGDRFRVIGCGTRGLIMADYHINIFYSEEDQGYIADIPDLESCSAFGETPEDALREAMLAKKLWLDAARSEGKPIPSPKYRPAIYEVA